MRINGEISPQEDEEKGEVKTVPLSVQQLQKLMVVGYALTSKKKKSFLQPKLEVLASLDVQSCKYHASNANLAGEHLLSSIDRMYDKYASNRTFENYPPTRNKGILFVAVDLNRSLSDQGPFDVILHKLSGKDWCEVIEDYQQKHPEVIVIDPPDAIQHLHNRQSMLQDVADLDMSDCQGKVFVPRQTVVIKDPLSIPHEVTKAGLKLPLVAKPLVVDGTAKSHELFLAYDEFSLSELEPPLVLQEFINHGGVLFKIYIVGEAIKVLRRFSLPNVSKRELAKVAGVFRFPRVSSASASADDADLDPSVGELPPRSLLERLARELRLRLGLQLFNIDMIREHGTKDVFYVIDINYFPGYGKMPDYEHTFTDFLLGLVQSKCKKRAAS